MESKGFTAAEETDKLLSMNAVWVITFTNSVSCVHLSLVNDPFERMSADCCVVLTHLIWICEGVGDVVGVVTPLGEVAEVVFHGVKVVEVGVGAQGASGQRRGRRRERSGRSRKGGRWGQGEPHMYDDGVKCDPRTSWANEVCMTQHQNKTRLRALCAVLTRAACACRGLRRETCWCNLCHDCCPHRSCWCCSCCRYSFRSHFRSHFSVVEDVLFTPPVGDSELR